jgi:hypothetical protein
MANTTAVCNTYKQEVLQGLHLSSNTYKISLIKVGATGTYNASMTNAGTPGTSAPSTANIGTDEVAASGSYAAGGLTLASFSATLQTSTGCLDFATASATTATISATGAMIYNSSVTNRAVATFDFGGTITSTAGTFTLTMPTVGASTSLIRIA